jgi:hypothetical protein
VGVVGDWIVDVGGLGVDVVVSRVTGVPVMPIVGVVCRGVEGGGKGEESQAVRVKSMAIVIRVMAKVA